MSLRGGDILEFREGYFFIPGTQKPVAKVSARMQENLDFWISKDYSVFESSVRFIVAWRAKDAPKDQEETAVLLPEIRLRKS